MPYFRVYNDVLSTNRIEPLLLDTMIMTPCLTRFIFVITICGILFGLGCLPKGAGDVADQSLEVELNPETKQSLQDRIDNVLDSTLNERKLSLDQHAAWQILHGALAYQRDFPVEYDGQLVSAVDHVLNGGKMKGWTIEPGIVLDEETDRRGLRAVIESGSVSGQGHADQWLAILAQCDLNLDQEIVLDGKTFSISDYVEQVKWDVPRNQGPEFSWTLIGLTKYLPTNSTWQASDDQEWSIERLLEAECNFAVGDGACGGTHRLIGITMALEEHQRQNGELKGVWVKSRNLINQAVMQAREFQNPDGSFSANYIQRGGATVDLSQVLGTTGHVLEFLSLALSPDELRQPWVQRSVVRLCEVFEHTNDIPLDCGKLYHAAHGLALYRDKVYGPRESPLKITSPLHKATSDNSTSPKTED